MTLTNQFSYSPKEKLVYAAKILILTLLYYAAGKLSFLVAQPDCIITLVIFAAEGFALAAVILFGRHIWPGIFFGQLILALSEGVPLLPSLSISAINSVEAIIAVTLFHHFKLKPSLAQLRDMIGLLLLIILVLQPFSATLGNLVLAMASIISWQDYSVSWFSWWFGNVMGQILIAPMILSLCARSKKNIAWELAFTGIVFSIFAYSLFIVFSVESLALLLSITTPIVIILAVYKGPGFASFATVILAATALYATSSGLGIFVEGDDINLLDLNYFIFTIIILALLIGVLVAEMRQQAQSLQASMKRLELTLGSTHQGWFDLDLLTGKTTVSDEYVRILGESPDTFQPSLERWKQAIHPDDLNDVLTVFNACLQGEKAMEVEYRQLAHDGSWRWIHSVGEVTEWNQGNASWMTGIHRDITDDKRSEQVLRILAESGTNEEINVFELIVKQLALSQGTRYALIAQVDSENVDQVNTIAVWSDGKLIDNFSYNLVGTPCINVTEEDVCFYPNRIQQLFPEDHLLTEMHAEGYLGIALKSDKGDVLGILALLDDKPMENHSKTLNLLRSLASRASIELEKINSEQKLQLSARVFNNIHEGIVITSADKLIIDVNPAFCQITGYSREDAIGQNPDILSSGKQSPENYQDMWDQIDTHDHWQGEVWNRKKSGEIYAELLTISVLRDDEDNIVNYVGVFTDITSSKKQQEQLSLMAHYDVLTGLPNRALFVDRFHQAIAHSNRTEQQLAVCFVDLDNFKPVNDNFGHEVGDQLLIEVAKRIKASIREEDTVSRQGGDEFALLLSDIESFSQCEQTLQRIHHVLAQPYFIDDYPHKVTASSGVTLYPHDDGDIDTLLRHADQAMYQAKLAGKHRYHLFNPEHDQRTIQKHHQLEEIDRALANNEFQLYYQPKVNMVTGKVFGAEALIRWIHPKKGLIPPLDFLPIIEETDVEIKIGNWVINQALEQLDIWVNQNINLEVSVNIASHHLLSESFFTELDTALAKHPSVDSKYLQLEILESSALGDLNAISTIIETCQGALGVNVALDDFGTGYSSLTHLRSLPVDTIKIDQSFVRDLLDDPSDYAIIDGVIGLAKSFNRQLIAEGVETTNHGLMLLAMGCEEAQGYGIAKPMPTDAFLLWLNHYTPNLEWQQSASKYRTTKENNLTLFRLKANHWKELLIHNIQSSPDDVDHWPIMNSKHCPCGAWIQRAQQEQSFDEGGLKQLSEAHEALHLIARTHHVHYCDGDREAALKGLPDIHAAFDEMNYVLALCAS